MTGDLFLAAAQGGDTLLQYQIGLDPDPLWAGAEARLTLVVSNGGRTLVDCASIRVTIPRGPQARDLTTDTSIGTNVDGWNASDDEDAIVFTPIGAAGSIGADGVTFTLSGFTINDQPGTALLGITETASFEGQPAQARSTSIELCKFPTAFTLGELDCNPDDIAPGGSTTLTWAGTGDNVSYALGYRAADGADPVEVSVGAVGPYTATGLTHSNSVIFTLSATMPVPGQDAPLVVKRHATVTIDTLTLNVEIDPPAVGVNGLVRLRWQAPNADYCTLEDGTRLPASGVHFLTLTQSRAFMVTAWKGDQSVQQQRNIVVDSTIQPTETGYAVTGAEGAAGASVPAPAPSPSPFPHLPIIDDVGASSGRGRAAVADDWNDPLVPPQFPWENQPQGGPGGAGGDARLDIALPSLDTTERPARVIPITLTGGRGGAGGAGAPFVPMGGASFGSGQGGPGGNAILNASLGKPGETPAQYIVVLTPGGGGDPGGSSGGVTLSIADEP